jgi:hypothetical protein
VRFCERRICSEVAYTNDLSLVDGELLPNRNITNIVPDSSTHKEREVGRGLGSGPKIYWLATKIVAHFGRTKVKSPIRSLIAKSCRHPIQAPGVRTRAMSGAGAHDSA